MQYTNSIIFTFSFGQQLDYNININIIFFTHIINTIPGDQYEKNFND